LICTVWKKDLEIKIAFNDGHIMTKLCSDEKDFESSWNTIQAICHSLGAEIKLK